MERESQSAHTRLIEKLAIKAPYINFYRFCQLLEQSQSGEPGLGATHSPQHEPVRFRPHPGMGFPVSELKSVETDPDHPERPPTVRTTFIGLYGVESPLPSGYIDDIAQQRDGSEVVSDFLDIFNHRLTTQFYRIWRKYSYPATFQPGGSDETSQYLLGLVGLGIPGSAAHVGTPISRFLALLGVLRLPTRTAEGIEALVKLLAPNTVPTVTPHDRLHIPLDTPAMLSCQQPVTLKTHPVMGRSAVDVNSQVLLTLTTTDPLEVRGWLPGGELHTDLLSLLHVYLGARLHARLQLQLPRSLLPDAQLSCSPGADSPQLGKTAIMRRISTHQTSPNGEVITISLGRYQCVFENAHYSEADNGEYQY
ncbi:type VI secretion system baseplate subunit TssG [Serratia aquatilis]|uniref:Type VI secretion system baseplate subunit TssG n=1 Tax=Serratia aquatilis TaxID=1737515 RepID=A0ABV6EI68_9GAMM